MFIAIYKLQLILIFKNNFIFNFEYAVACMHFYDSVGDFQV